MLRRPQAYRNIFVRLNTGTRLIHLVITLCWWNMWWSRVRHFYFIVEKFRSVGPRNGISSWSDITPSCAMLLYRLCITCCRTGTRPAPLRSNEGKFDYPRSGQISPTVKGWLSRHTQKGVHLCPLVQCCCTDYVLPVLPALHLWGQTRANSITPDQARYSP